MHRLTIDGRPVEAPPGATLLDAARQLGIAIPTLCHAPGLPPGTSCMVCVVEIDASHRLAPACAYPARSGLVVRTDTPAVRSARRTALELLMGEHVGDCEGPCRRGCPAGLEIPRMLRQIAAGRPAEALATVRREIALPGVLGRICPAPCEKVCRRARLDQPVAICRLKRFAADHGAADVPQMGTASGRRVAVVGAGPAGLAAAFHLRRLGHACEVFDDRPGPGGELRRGVPEARLPREALERDIDAIRRLGAVFHPGVRIGRDRPLADLRAAFDAVILAAGTLDEAAAAALGVPGQAVEGVFPCGGLVRPLKMAVRACADGKAAAQACDRYLRPAEAAAEAKRFNCAIGRLEEPELKALRDQASAAPRVEPAAGEAGGYGAAEAAAEAARCLRCDCRKAEACRLREAVEASDIDARRYSDPDRLPLEVRRESDGLVFEPGKCIKCGVCIRLTQAHPEAPGLSFERRGFQMRVSPPAGETFTTALGPLAAEAVAACPTGALAWDRGDGECP